MAKVLNKRVDEKIKYYDKHPYEKRLHDIAESSGFSDQLYSTIIYCITGYVEYKKYSQKEQPITKEQIEEEITEGTRKIKVNEVYKEIKGDGKTFNQKVLDKMNDPIYKEHNIDCSEIAEDLYNTAGKKGKIYNIKGKNGTIYGYEYGKIEPYDYHHVYSDGEYIYDPRYSETPVLKDDYFRDLNKINPEGFNVFELKNLP